MTASGCFTSGRIPRSTSIATVSSGDRLISEYVPGRSIRSIQVSSSRLHRPVFFSKVTPGELATFWRRPVRALKIVVLPLLGLPASATVIVAVDDLGESGWEQQED